METGLDLGQLIYTACGCAARRNTPPANARSPRLTDRLHMVATGELERWPVATRRSTRTHRTRHGRRAAASACTPPRAHVGPAPREEEVVEALLSPRGQALGVRVDAKQSPRWAGPSAGLLPLPRWAVPCVNRAVQQLPWSGSRICTFLIGGVPYSSSMTCAPRVVSDLKSVVSCRRRIEDVF